MKGWGYVVIMEHRLFRTIVMIQIQDYKWIMDSIQKFGFDRFEIGRMCWIVGFCHGVISIQCVWITQVLDYTGHTVHSSNYIQTDAVC